MTALPFLPVRFVPLNLRVKIYLYIFMMLLCLAPAISNCNPNTPPAVTGNIVANSSFTPPTIQAGKVNFTATSYNTTTVNWTNGNGTARAVFVAQATSGAAAPVNGTTYTDTADPVLGQGTEIGTTGWYCIYNGTGSSTTLWGSPGVTYRVTVVDYNGTPGNEAYLTPGLAPGDLNYISTRLSPANVTMLMVAPTIPAAKVVFANTTFTGTTARWTNGNGQFRAVFISKGANGSPSPATAANYTANPAFGSGSEIGATGWYCVYNGTGSSVDISGLTEGTTYRVSVVEYNPYFNKGDQYLTTGQSPANVTTMATIPVTPARLVKFTNTTNTGTTASWTNGTGSARAVFIFKGANGSPLPAGGTAYTANPAYGFGTAVGSSGWYCIYNGTGSSVNITGLTYGVTYRVSVVEYNVIAGSEDYLTTGQSPANVTPVVVAIAPTVQASQITFTNTLTYSTTANWTNGNGASRAVFVSQGTSGTALPVNGTNYAANETFGQGSQIGSTGWYCVFNGTSFPQQEIDGLEPGTTYRVTVVEYNTSPQGNLYLTTGQSPANVTPSIVATAPTVQASQITFNNTNINSTYADWTEGNGAYRAVFISEGTSGTALPVDGTNYTANGTFGQGQQIGSTGWYCVYNGTGYPQQFIQGLVTGTTYRVTVVEYNISTQGNLYLTTGQSPANVTPSIVAVAPTVQASQITFNNTNINSTYAVWTEGNGAYRAVFISAGTSGTALPVDGTDYTADGTFGQGQQIGSTGWYCIYNGTGYPQQYIDGLATGTTYRVTVVEYNISAQGNLYLTTGQSPANVTPSYVATAPTVQASQITFNTTNINSTEASWTIGNGAYRAMFISAGTSGTALPVDLTNYTANGTYGQGSQIGSTGWYCVYNGTGYPQQFIGGLETGTTYRVTVVEYNISAQGNLYLTAGQSPANVTPSYATIAPTVQASLINFTNTSTNSTDANWTDGNGAYHAVFISAGTSGTALPADGTNYTGNETFGQGSQIGSTGWYCVYSGAGYPEQNIDGLDPGTTYRVTVVEYNITAGGNLYLTTGQSPANVTTATTLNHIFQGGEPFPLISSLNDQKVEPNNILTPNGDGVNDTWMVKNITNYPNNKVTVYDRTGNIIFSKQGYANDWAGTYRGSVLNQGTYYYLVELGNGSTLRGFITVVRDR